MDHIGSMVQNIIVILSVSKRYSNNLPKNQNAIGTMTAIGT